MHRLFLQAHQKVAHSYILNRQLEKQLKFFIWKVVNRLENFIVFLKQEATHCYGSNLLSEVLLTYMFKMLPLHSKAGKRQPTYPPCLYSVIGPQAVH